MGTLSDLGGAIRYAGTVIHRSWSDTTRFYGWGGRTVFLVVGPFLVGVLLRAFWNSDDIGPFIESALYGVAATGVLFPALFVWNLILAPTRIDAELRARIAGLERQTQSREQKQAIADLLNERYEAGVVIRDSTKPQFSTRDAVNARRWHTKNLRILEGEISPDEFYLYRTIVPNDPPLERGRLTFGILFTHRDLEKFTARLEKLRLMVARHIKATEQDS